MRVEVRAAYLIFFVRSTLANVSLLGQGIVGTMVFGLSKCPNQTDVDLQRTSP